MANYEDEDEEGQQDILQIPKYILLYEDPEITSKLPSARRDNFVKESENEYQRNEEGEGEPEKEKPMDIIIKAIAEIASGKKLSDKQIAIELKKRLDQIPELNKPSISGPEIEENGVWQVIIGKQFTASVTFDAKYIYYFKIEEKLGPNTEENIDDGTKYFLVFRS